jgi:hypothetical protein
MKCRACRDRLQQALDSRGRVELPAASADCPDCAAWFAAARRLTAGLRLLTPPAPPPGLAFRVAARFAADRRALRLRRVTAAAGLAVAAALLLAVGARLLRPEPPPAPIPAPPPIAQDGPTPPSGGSAPDLRVAANEAGEALSSLTTRTADKTVEKTRLLLPVVVDPSLAKLDLQPPLGPPTRPFREAGEGMSSGLEPVTTAAGRAIRLFVDELPMEKKEKPDL